MRSECNFVSLETDIEIWERFKEGDEDALTFVYFQYFHSMYQYGMKFSEDSEFIKDCIQDVFVKLIKSGSNLGATDNIQYYLFKALKNVIYKAFEKQKKIETIKTETVKFHSPFLLEEQILEKEDMSNKEKALAKALGELSERQREIIYLRYECEMTYEQICDIMQIKNESARKLVFRAIKSIKAIIEEQIKTTLLFFACLVRKNVL